MKRILHVIAGMNSGGMETMIMNYYRNIDRSKIQFDFLIYTEGKAFYEDEINKLGGKIFKVTSRRKNPLKNYKEIKEFFKNNKYEIAHFHQGPTYYYPLKMAKNYGVEKRIIHNHGINRMYKKVLKYPLELWLKPRICGLATDYIACSDNVLDHLFTKKIINEKNYIIINNAIDVEKFKFNNYSRNKIRNDLKIKENEILALHIGTFTTPKNHLFLIDVFENQLKENTNLKLALVGEGPLRKNVEDYIKEKKIENKVIFLGRRENVNEILSAADYMIFPSLYEGLPLTIVEAQANGLPILMSDTITEKVIQTDLVKSLGLDRIETWRILNRNLDESIKYNKKLADSIFSILNEGKKLEKLYK